MSHTKKTIKLLSGKRVVLPETCGNQYGYHCPACGSSKSIHVSTSQMVLLVTDGTDEHGDAEWNDDSYAECSEGACDWTGIVDQLVTKKINETTLEYL